MRQKKVNCVTRRFRDRTFDYLAEEGSKLKPGDRIVTWFLDWAHDNMDFTIPRECA
ncbi:MAG: hypothetical protein WBD95_22375 [Xanthobacteraceae bacterium]